ncbi:MAG: DUF4350 domain-containing protein, partial [Candidatus Latescibacterota bacterium]
MTPTRQAGQAGAAFLLLLAIGVWAGRLAGLAGGGKLDLGGGEPATLEPGARDFLRDLDDELLITYLVTPRERMPSHLQRLEEDVRALLQALQDSAPERVRYRVLYPELGGPLGVGWAARQRASPLHVRRVEDDQDDEQPIWSSLVLAWGQRPPLLVQGIEATDLPHLEDLLLEELRAAADPGRRPVPTLAVAAPADQHLLESLLAEHGQVVRVGLDEDADLPPEADLLFWVQPGRFTPEHARRLRRFVDSGRSVVLAGSSWRIAPVPGAHGPAFQAVPLGPAWEELLRPLGLRPQPDLLLDRGAEALPVRLGDPPERWLEAAFNLRCLPAFYDLRSFGAPAQGALSFAAASPLAIDPRAVAEAGFRAGVVATTTDEARVLPLPEGPFTPADLEAAVPVPRQNLMVLLTPEDPWRGRILVLSSPAALSDATLLQPGHGHAVFLATLVRTFAGPEPLARIRTPRRAPPSLAAAG